MRIWKIITKWWKNNQEKSSERYIEREELIKELDEYSKDVLAISKSPIFNINDRALGKAILVQNLHSQRNLSKATDSLKLVTWILALATIVFAWVTITDSPNSNYIIQTLQSIGGFILLLIMLGIGITLLWKIILFIFEWGNKILKKK